MTVGDFMAFTAYLVFMIAPVFQMVGIGTQITEALAGLDRTHEVLSERPENRDPKRVQVIPSIQGHVIFDDVTFAYDEGKTVLNAISFESAPGSGDCPCRTVGFRQIDHHRLDRRVPHAESRNCIGGWL